MAATGATVRSVGSGFLRGFGGHLSDGEVIEAAGLRITVLSTPGHTADSVSFVLDDAVLTADTVLGRGTAVIDAEDGSLADYLESLRRLGGLGSRRVLPGHGPELADLGDTVEMYLTHRAERLDQVRAALGVLGEDATARQVVEHVYSDVGEDLWDAAESSVRPIGPSALEPLSVPTLARADLNDPDTPRVSGNVCVCSRRARGRADAGTGDAGSRAATERARPAVRNRRSARSCPRAGSSRGGRSRPAPC